MQILQGHEGRAAPKLPVSQKAEAQTAPSGRDLAGTTRTRRDSASELPLAQGLTPSARCGLTCGPCNARSVSGAWRGRSGRYGCPAWRTLSPSSSQATRFFSTSRDDERRGGRHHGVEVPRGLAIDEVAELVGLPGLDQRQVGVQAGLENVLAGFALPARAVGMESWACPARASASSRRANRSSAAYGSWSAERTPALPLGHDRPRARGGIESRNARPPAWCSASVPCGLNRPRAHP